jgi:DNA-directed RNA polymerase specialized sigma24 family protein
MSTDELMDLIQALPAGYRTVFNLFAIEGYAHKEIADRWGSPRTLPNRNS